MKLNEFALPDELGWEANDEVAKTINEWLVKLGKHRADSITMSNNEYKFFMDVAIAELSDDIYSVIKKYQETK